MSVDQSGSTLIIAVAEDNDAGKYKCTLTLGDNLQQVEHTVIVRGENLFLCIMIETSLSKANH